MAPNGYRKITSTNEFTEKVGFVSILLFQWMNEVMKTGNQRALEESDFVPLSLKSTEMKRKDDLILEDVEFIAASGTLTVITGPVGSGKSTLLLAIAGEMSDISGTISRHGTFVYAPQVAWVFSGTLRENILFGESYNESRYTRVIEACALTKDFQQFPNGDETVVGERGAVLSGGQRARVNLARAVYVDADLYLLDDPLSAVDFKVGQHIFEKCIKDVLGKKTRLLTSHQEPHMIDADQVIILYKGRVLGKGTYVELQDKGILNTTIYPLCKNTLIEKFNGLEISVEDRAIGTVSSKLYWDYFRGGIHPLLIIGVVILCLITQASMVAPDVWLSFLTRKRPSEQRDKTNLAIYGCFVAASFILGIVRCYILFLVCLRCSERLHDKMVVALLQAPVLFFDSNPVGRILNRFSKDVGCMDELLPLQFLSTVQLVLLLFSSVIVPSVTNPWLVFVTIPVTAMILYFARFYLKSSRELKRLESMCRSPVFSHISETLEGLDTIRTRGRQKDFIEKFYSHQDTHIQSFIMMMASGRWFAVRLDAIISLLVGLVILVAVLISQDAASAGLALAYVIQTVALTQYAVRKSSDVENFMTSVERVMAYTKLDSEPGYKVDRPPPEHWPRKGNIIFNDVSLTYYPGGPQALKSINLGIKGGSKIGVVGRTGAGKSSFVSALLRMPDPDGEILVDGIQIKEINLQAARGSSAGLALAYVIQTVALTQYAVRKSSDVENFMTSVERVMAYTKLDSEPGYKVDRPPPEHWPRKGNIIFNDVSLTYYPGGPQALKSINLGIKGGSKIGVVGRTGAGKSSFVSALLRMPDPDGEILVDGIQIKEINLQAARGCISSLGQTPVLFSGSLRKNLDIVQRFQDVDLWRVLEDVQLKDFVESLEGQLEYELLENGANVSMGERQLICLARVLLQQNKIIILDEPTAHVDPGTEETIWRVVREKLKDSTVITVAHRLSTIQHCDKVFVFKEGGVVESGTFDA
ncbi:multidrug resistance-associated protein 4-like [Stylophora pistillata]|uniref:multidrug resistance-associated protein 4-like n=1 Tax=Stylophora pistillata TaxID=50429 RepID=UPI000C04DC6A|nr:multidrug resistance-associated protein 4-like [Stylophora pistillata]